MSESKVLNPSAVVLFVSTVIKMKLAIKNSVSTQFPCRDVWGAGGIKITFQTVIPNQISKQEDFVKEIFKLQLLDDQICCVMALLLSVR